MNGTTSSGSAHGCSETISTLTSPRLVLVTVTVRSMAYIRISCGIPIQPSLSEIAVAIRPTATVADASVASITAPMSCAPQSPSPATACTISVAMQTDRANCPRLKTSLMNGRRRSRNSVIAEPRTVASRRSLAEASTRPKTSGTSPSENEWALRENWRCTTQRSATRKPTASHHQSTWGTVSSGMPRATPK
jgi:hypothetical protein